MKNMKNHWLFFAWLWLVFTGIFAFLAYYHYGQSQFIYPDFKWVEQKGDFDFMGRNIIEIEKNLKSYISNWNDYIKEQNENNKNMNRKAALGYLVSAIISFISLITTISDYRKRNRNTTNTTNYHDSCCQDIGLSNQNQI
jgi:type IV secretory pathway TraG/TraD family ATPase VirD4